MLVLRPAVLRTAIASLARGKTLFVRAIQRKEQNTDCCRAVLGFPAVLEIMRCPISHRPLTRRTV